MKLFLLICLSLGIMTNTLATNNQNRKVTDIYYMNGMNNTRETARSTRDSLESIYKPQLLAMYPTETFNFIMGYNRYNKSFLLKKELREVFLQKMIEFTDLDENSAFNVQRWWFANSASQKLHDYIAQREDGEKILKYLNKYEAESTLLINDRSKNFVSVKGDLMSGHRVILFANSQGNLFANSIYDDLQNEPTMLHSLGIVSVATPASRAWLNRYVTATDDVVINKIRYLAIIKGYGNRFDALPGWVTNSDADEMYKRTSAKHYLLPDYMHPALPSRAIIDTYLFQLCSELPFPEPTLGDGALKIRLMWGKQPDVDLHIKEPDGTIVNYTNKRGSSGYLDRDDTDGYGPEHYYVEWDQLQEGFYEIGVIFYSGQSPELADIEIVDAYKNVTQKSVMLTGGGIASSHWNKATKVAKIEVLKDPITGSTRFYVYQN